MQNSTTLIDLIRHGEPVGGRKYRGQTDDPLSEKGWHQMREAVGEHRPWDIVVTSTLSRCQVFAEEVAQRHALALELEPRFKEIGFGQWEGKTAEQLMQADPDALQRFWLDPVNNTPPGAETLDEFASRIVPAWDDLTQRHAGKHILAVGHAGMMRMIIRHVLAMPLGHMFRLQVENAAITRIQIDGVGASALPRLIFHGGSL